MTSTAELQYYGAMAAHYFGIRGNYAIRYGRMPSEAPGTTIYGYAISNAITIAPFLQQTAMQDDLLNTVCHEMRHVWQYQTGFRFDYTVPYWVQPHEVDARAHADACAAAIGKHPVQVSTADAPVSVTDHLTSGVVVAPTQPTVALQPTDIDYNTSTVLVVAVFVMTATAWWVSNSNTDDEEPTQHHPALQAVIDTVTSGKAFQWGVGLVATGFFGFGLYKTYLAVAAGGWFFAVVWSGTHLAYLIFALPFTFLMLARKHDGMAMIATAFILINAVLV